MQIVSNQLSLSSAVKHWWVHTRARPPSGAGIDVLFSRRVSKAEEPAWYDGNNVRAVRDAVVVRYVLGKDMNVK